ncbi:hypothetical protein Tco_1273446 [Tanacetum coccineum]
MPNVLPTHQSLCQDLDFTLSTDFSGSDLVVSFPSRNRNKTFDPRISIEVQSKRFLLLNKFSISFISDPLSPVLETLLPFSSEIEDKVFKPGILVSKEEKSPLLLSHRGFKAFKIINNFLNKSSMMIYGEDMPILDDLPDYEDSRARGFVQRLLGLHFFACLFWESYFNKDFEIFSNPLFDSYNDSTSSDDESFSDEDVLKENFKIYLNPLFDEEIISTKIDPHHFNAESGLIESLLNKNTVITSPKIDFLLEEFVGDLTLINPNL